MIDFGLPVAVLAFAGFMAGLAFALRGLVFALREGGKSFETIDVLAVFILACSGMTSGMAIGVGVDMAFSDNGTDAPVIAGNRKPGIIVENPEPRPVARNRGSRDVGGGPEALFIATNPKAWLCGRIGDSPVLTLDGAAVIIRKKIGQMERAIGRTDDGKELMLYGSAVGALKRLERDMEIGVCPQGGK